MHLSTMKQISLDAAKWQSKNDVYSSFFQAVGAPDWHGRNLDALNDSIANGSINKIEVPYRLVIKNYGNVGDGARQMADDFIDLIRDIASRGCPVEIQVEST